MPDFINIYPEEFSKNIEEDITISFDIISSGTVDRTTIRIYIDSQMVYNGYYFLPPFNNATITSTVVYGDSGYHIELINSKTFNGFVNVCVKADIVGGGDENIYSWSFLVGSEINTLYFSDSEGLKKINIRDLVGESQREVKTFFTAETYPSIPYNLVSSIHGNVLPDGKFYLALSYDSFSDPDGYGVVVVRDEQDIDVFSDGYSCLDGQITDDGKLYLINKDMNQIEVYYSLPDFFLDPPHVPDFIYSSSSTPALLSGEILTLHVVSGMSTKYDGGTRLYIGTENGMNRIECYDRMNNDGTPYGSDHLGVSYSYSIEGGAGTYKAIGGTIPRVTSISSHDEEDMCMVVTQDGAGDGGVTQISLTGNKKVIYMTHDGRYLPSSEIRDIARSRKGPR